MLTDPNYLIRKVGTNFTQIIHRIRLTPIVLQNTVENLLEINRENFQTGPLLRKYRGEQNYFDKGLPALRENENQTKATNPKTNFGSPVRVSISFETTPQQAAVPAVIALVPVPPLIQQNNAPEPGPIVPPRRVSTPPYYLTAQLPESSEESD